MIKNHRIDLGKGQVYTPVVILEQSLRELPLGIQECCH